MGQMKRLIEDTLDMIESMQKTIPFLKIGFICELVSKQINKEWKLDLLPVDIYDIWADWNEDFYGRSDRTSQENAIEMTLYEGMYIG